MQIAVRRWQVFEALPFVIGHGRCRKPNARNSLKFSPLLLWLAVKATTELSVK